MTVEVGRQEHPPPSVLFSGGRSSGRGVDHWTTPIAHAGTGGGNYRGGGVDRTVQMPISDNPCLSVFEDEP